MPCKEKHTDNVTTAMKAVKCDWLILAVSYYFVSVSAMLPCVIYKARTMLDRANKPSLSLQQTCSTILKCKYFSSDALWCKSPLFLVNLFAMFYFCRCRVYFGYVVRYNLLSVDITAFYKLINYSLLK